MTNNKGNRYLHINRPLSFTNFFQTPTQRCRCPSLTSYLIVSCLPGGVVCQVCYGQGAQQLPALAAGARRSTQEESRDHKEPQDLSNRQNHPEDLVIKQPPPPHTTALSIPPTNLQKTCSLPPWFSPIITPRQLPLGLFPTFFYAPLFFYHHILSQDFILDSLCLIITYLCLQC